MKNLLKILFLTVTVGTLNAGSIMPQFALVAGARVGYNYANDIKKSIATQEYGQALGQGAQLVAGGAALQGIGGLVMLHNLPIQASIVPTMSLDPYVESLAQKYVKLTTQLGKTLHVGGRFMLLTPLAMLGYECAKQAYYTLTADRCLSPEAEKAAQESSWAKVGAKFSLLPATMKAEYQKVVHDATIDRGTLTGNK